MVSLCQKMFVYNNARINMFIVLFLFTSPGISKKFLQQILWLLILWLLSKKSPNIFLNLLTGLLMMTYTLPVDRLYSKVTINFYVLNCIRMSETGTQCMTASSDQSCWASDSTHKNSCFEFWLIISEGYTHHSSQFSLMRLLNYR